MGNLARALALAFENTRTEGWRCQREVPIFSRRLADRYGFRPAVDVLLEGPEGQRVAVEFEIARADPVSNQVKFLLAYRAGEFGENDALVSMFSPAITRGRRCMSAVFARHLRQEGIPAFQVSLVPHLERDQMQDLNQGDEDLPETVSAKAELARVVSVVVPRGERAHRIHFAGDVADVIANVWTWNDEIVRPERAALWGERRVQWFVRDLVGGEFAPAKFAAFLPSMRPGGVLPTEGTMTLEIYASLGEKDPRFDGHRARIHLEKKLAFTSTALAGSAHETAFADWLARHASWITPREPVSILTPPRWFS